MQLKYNQIRKELDSIVVCRATDVHKKSFDLHKTAIQCKPSHVAKYVEFDHPEIDVENCISCQKKVLTTFEDYGTLKWGSQFYAE